MAIEKKHFTGGLNSDTEDRLLPDGDYRYTLNVRASKSDNSNEGLIENTKGNTELTVALPNGQNRVIGAYDDLDNNLVFYFLFNEFRNHTIYQYNPVTNSIVVVLQTPLLNFSSVGYINDARVVGEQLFFNDRINQPREINYVRAIANGYPTPFIEQYINAIAYPPGFPPLTEFFSDPLVKVNNVRGVLRQFRTAFIYEDNKQSAWSPISKTALPVDEAVYRPLDYYPTELNNGIDITFDLGGDTVVKILVAVREGNSGDFGLVEEIEKSKIPLTSIIPGNTYVYKFYNDKSYTPLDNDGNTGMRLFDSIPLKADSQELIDGNRIAYGGITEFFDPVDVDMDVVVNRDNSVLIPSPKLNITRNTENASSGFGLITTADHFWNKSYDAGTKWLRQVNGQTYRLDQLGWQEARNNPSSSPFINNWSTTTQRSIIPSFSAGTHDRIVYMTNESTGALIQGSGGSCYNEIVLLAPTTGTTFQAGIRFVQTISVRWYDIGGSDALISEKFKVQYTTSAGDDTLTVAHNLITKFNNLGVNGIITRGKVEIKFNTSSVGGYSRMLHQPLGVGQQSYEVWVEAYVPPANVVNPAFVQGVSRSWIAGCGDYVPALYSIATDLKGYADWTTQNRKTLKSGANHSVGIVYYNEGNQSGLTNVDVQKTFYVPHFTELGIPSGSIPNQTSLTLTINHRPPSWASRYQIVYSGNQTIEKLPVSEGYMGFVQFQLKSVSNSSVAGAIECEISNIIAYNDDVPENIDLGYSFTKGDRIRLITTPINQSTGAYDYLTDYKDVEIISFDDLTNVLIFKDPGVTVSNNQLVEVYTPKKKVDDVVYSEIGETYSIINGLHQGDTPQTASGNPAVIELEDIGDVYLRYRTAPMLAQVEDYAFTDYYKSDSWDRGRPNIVDNNIKEIKRPSTIRFSNVYIPETNINGLSRFDDFDFEAYDQRYGSIQRMYSEDKDLVVFQNLKVGAVRIGQNTLYSNDGGTVATVKSENKVLSDIVYYKGEFGIGINPESFAVYGNRKYFTDVARGAVLRLGGDGITEISEYKMHNYFNDTFKTLMDNGGNYKIFGVYDVRFDEYIISIRENIINIPTAIGTFPPPSTIIIPQEPNIFLPPTPPTTVAEPISASGSDRFFSSAISATGTDSILTSPTLNTGTATDVDAPLFDITEGLVVGGSVTGVAIDLPLEPVDVEGFGYTIAFSEYKKRWVTFYSYLPDYMLSNNISLVSFKNGQLYTHNTNGLYNNFYNNQYSSIVELLSNVEPSSIKFYNNIYTESSSPFSMLARNQFGQETSLIVDDFVDDEGVWKAALLRDVNTPNVTNPLFEGDEMRCHSMVVRLENIDTELVTIFSVGIGLNPSQLTSR